MDPKLVRVAKEIPSRLKDVMSSMFDQSQPALRSGVAALRDSLQKLDSYLRDVEREHLGSTTAVGRKTTSTETTEHPTRRRRRRGRFATAEFIVATVSKAGKPQRPVDLAVALSEQTGRPKSNSLNNVNTTLSRLVQQKRVTKVGEGLYISSGATAATSVRKTTKRPRRRKKSASA